jgi:hypothetical protein
LPSHGRLGLRIGTVGFSFRGFPILVALKITQDKNQRLFSTKQIRK